MKTLYFQFLFLASVFLASCASVNTGSYAYDPIYDGEPEIEEPIANEEEVRENAEPAENADYDDYADSDYQRRYDGSYSSRLNRWNSPRMSFQMRFGSPYYRPYYGGYYDIYYSPWGARFYDPWYDPWYDPFYSPYAWGNPYYGNGWGRYNGWYSPYYSPYYGGGYYHNHYYGNSWNDWSAGNGNISRYRGRNHVRQSPYKTYSRTRGPVKYGKTTSGQDSNRSRDFSRGRYERSREGNSQERKSGEVRPRNQREKSFDNSPRIQKRSASPSIEKQRPSRSIERNTSPRRNERVSPPRNKESNISPRRTSEPSYKRSAPSRSNSGSRSSSPSRSRSRSPR